MSDVDVVIVNWNAGDQLRQCVESLMAVDRSAVASVTVVDNGSHDGSADFLDGRNDVRLLRAGENLGFGRACNLGAARGRAPYILLLNPDTRLLRPTLGQVTAFMDGADGEGYGVCGVRLVGEDGHIARHCSRFPSARTFFFLSSGLAKVAPRRFPPLELVDFDHLHDRPVDHVMGAFYVIRRTLFDRLAGFDERFFVYYEDLDLSWRAAIAGQGAYYLSSVEVFHRGAGTSRNARAKALSYILESRLRYADKHFGWCGRLLVSISTLLIDPPMRVAFALVQGSPATAWEAVRAHGRYWRERLGGGGDRS